SPSARRGTQQVEEHVVRPPRRILQLRPRPKRLIGRTRLFESPQLKPGVENPAQPILQGRPEPFRREVTSPFTPRVLERPALEIAVDAQPSLRAALVLLPDAEGRIGAGVRDRGDESTAGSQQGVHASK